MGKTSKAPLRWIERAWGVEFVVNDPWTRYDLVYYKKSRHIRSKKKGARSWGRLANSQVVGYEYDTWYIVIREGRRSLGCARPTNLFMYSRPGRPRSNPRVAVSASNELPEDPTQALQGTAVRSTIITSIWPDQGDRNSTRIEHEEPIEISLQFIYCHINIRRIISSCYLTVNS